MVGEIVFPADILTESAELVAALRGRGLKIATAESCTGGLIAAALTEIAGASDVVDRSFVTYSNSAKTGMLGVDPQLIWRHGAVSAEVAGAMAKGALYASAASLAVAVTGIAGPTGGSPMKPIGLVFLATARAGAPVSVRECRFGDLGRSGIRLAALREAFRLISAAVSG